MCCSEKGVEDEEDLYDCVYDDEDGGEIYEDLMKTEAIPPPVSPAVFISQTSITKLLLFAIIVQCCVRSQIAFPQRHRFNCPSQGPSS